MHDPKSHRKWDASSQLSVDEQRRQLVEAYINEDVLDPEILASPPSRVPTAAEVAEILAPWRPEGEDPHFYLLRTHYSGGAEDDAKLRGWLDEGLDSPGIEPEDEWFSVLDDTQLFDVGDDWQEVYAVFPELAAPKPDRRFTDEDVGWAQSRAEKLIRNEPDEPEEKHYADAIRQVAALTGPPWLVVLDEEAFRTGDLGLIFRDTKGNSVKEIKIEPDMLYADFYARFERGMTYEGYWEDAYIFKKYRTQGEIMRKLMPLVKGGSSPANAS